MEADRKVVCAALLFGALLGFAMTSGASGEEPVVKAATAAPSSSSAHASISATIIERPDFPCDQVLRSVTVEIVADPPLPDDQLHPVAIPRFGCAALQGMFSVTSEITPIEPATGQPAALADGVGLSGHRHSVEVTYNFE